MNRIKVAVDDEAIILNDDYEILFSQIATPLQCLGWLSHLGQKLWIDKDVLAKVINHAAAHHGWKLHPVGRNDRITDPSEAESISNNLIDAIADVWGKLLDAVGQGHPVLVRHIATQLRCSMWAILEETQRNRQAIIADNEGFDVNQAIAKATDEIRKQEDALFRLIVENARARHLCQHEWDRPGDGMEQCVKCRLFRTSSD